MLLKWCVFIVILSHKVVSCHTNVETGTKKNSISITANNTSAFGRSSIVHKKKTSLDMKLYPTIKEAGRSASGRWLEEYHVVTSDEYILTVFRLTYKNNEPPPKKCPVLLVHGIFQSSDRFLQQTEDQSLALKLQDLDYDVWLANFRGNQYGRLHVSLNPETVDKLKFFNYSYEEFGLYDVASTVDFVLNMTNSEKLHYIGHSLGGTAFLVLNSLKPEYNNKFATTYLMAPLGYQHYFPNDYLKAEVSRLDELYETLIKEGAIEIFPFTDKYIKFSIEDCLGYKRYKKICEELNIQKCMALKYVNNDVSDTRGGSLKPLVHLAQNIRSQSFSRWDFGKIENKKQYGNHIPPVYNLSLITAPTNILYTQNDEFVSPEDITHMVKNMVNAKSTKVGSTYFKHQDFIFASDVMETVYAVIIKDMEENPKKCGKNNEKNNGNNRSSELESSARSFKGRLLCFSMPFVIALIAILGLVCYRQLQINRNKCSIEPYWT